MAAHNPNNERIKRRYFVYLKEAMRYNEATVDQVAKALARFEADTGNREFKAFRSESAIAFKRHLAAQVSQVSGRALSKATLYATLAHLKRFFHWLAGQAGYRSLSYSDAEYFNLSEKDTRIATARRERAYPTLEQVQRALTAMPSGSDVERRNRALVAFTLLTGARDSAIASMKLKHIDLVEEKVYQDAREVNTKYSKSFTTFFFPVGEEVTRIVAAWVEFLRRERLWGNDDPLFPATETVVGDDRQFKAGGLKREHWRSAASIRAIFREAFAAAGLPYFNPHSFRSTLVQLGERLCRNPEDFKACSQNMGHEGVLTTFTSYGAVGSRRQGEVIRGLDKRPPEGPLSTAEFARAVARELRSSAAEVSSRPSAPSLDEDASA